MAINTKANTKTNVYEIVKENLLTKIEEQINTPKDERTRWIKPWSIANSRLMNYVTRRRYRGINLWLLDGHGSSEFLTFTQLQELQSKGQKCTIKKGAKSHMVVFFKVLENETTNKDGDEVTEKIPMLRYFKVFSLNDIDGLETKVPHEIYDHTNIKERELQLNDVLVEYMEREGISVRWTDEGKAYYTDNDLISIPSTKYFQSYSRFLDTLAHECGHSTGKALGRKVYNPKGSDAYSYEELVAEFTSVLLMTRFGLTSELDESQSAAYITSWYSNIKNCPARLLVNAFSAAEKSAAYILNEKEDV